MYLTPYSASTYLSGQSIQEAVLTPSHLSYNHESYERDDFEIIDDSNSIIDYSLPNNRLVEGPGYIIVQEKPVGYIIGELLIRPMIDISAHFINWAFQITQRMSSAIDSVVSQAFNFIPAAQATEMGVRDTSSCEIVAYSSLEIKAAPVWGALGIDPESYARFVDNLSPEQKLELVRDINFQENFAKVREIMTDLASFIIKKASGHTEFTTSLIEGCKRLKGIEKTLVYILDDLNHHLERSDFSPTSNIKTVGLVLLKYSSDFQRIEQRDLFLKDGKKNG
jgi:hypothetical protein